MAIFTIVQSDSGMQYVVWTEDIFKRDGDRGITCLGNKNESITICGSHENFKLLNDMCRQNNMSLFVIKIDAHDCLIKNIDQVTPIRQTNDEIVNISKRNVFEDSSSKDDIEQPHPSRRVVNKRNVCKFCFKKVTQLPKHLEAMHHVEIEVKEFLIFPKGSAKRRDILNKIRQEGNFQHMLRSDKDIVPSRILHNRPMDRQNYVPCSICHAILTKPALPRHFRKCSKRKNVANLRSSKVLVERLHNIATPIMRNSIFAALQDGKVKETIRFDRLLIIYGNEMCSKYRDQHFRPMIRNRLRLMANFLIHIKKRHQSASDFASILTPEYYDATVCCINILGQYDDNLALYIKPTIPTNIGTALKYIIRLHINECIKNRDKNSKEAAEELMHLLLTSLPSQINKTATESLLHLKRQKQSLMPTTSDIKKLNKFVLENRNRLYKKLEENGFVFKCWLELSKFTVISILIFNRRRPGELERCLLTDLQNLQSVKTTDEGIFNKLSEDGQHAVENYVRFCIRGKLARGVPVLLHLSMHSCIQLIQRYRQEANIDSKNPYVFALPQIHVDKNDGTFRHLTATKLLKLYADMCGAAKPDTLRATQLRKHIATTSVNLNLNNNEISQLQNFLGHEDKVHKEYYRQPIIENDIINMSKLLEIARGDNFEDALTNVDDKLEFSEADDGMASININPSTSTNPLTESTHMSIEETDCSMSNLPSCSWQTAPQCRKQLFSKKSSSSSSSSEDLSPARRRRTKLLSDVSMGTISRRTWSTPEKHTILEIFENNISSKKIPNKQECLIAIEKNPCLKGRTVPQIRSFVCNRIKINSQEKSSVSRNWTTPERRTVRTIFEDYIICKDGNYAYPSRGKILQAVAQFPSLQSRTPKRIKSQIQHYRKLHFAKR